MADSGTAVALWLVRMSSPVEHAPADSADLFLLSTCDLDRLIAELESSSSNNSPRSVERRSMPRLRRDQVGDDIRVSLAGHPATLLNVSATGILIDIPRRLCPGHAIDVFIRSESGRRTLRALVIRSHVQSIAPHPLYRAALQFERELALPECAA